METMTVIEIIQIVAAKLMYCFLWQIQQILQKHEDISCSVLYLTSSIFPASTSCVKYVTVDVFTVTGCVK
jgi:hypothetical protein